MKEMVQLSDICESTLYILGHYLFTTITNDGNSNNVPGMEIHREDNERSGWRDKISKNEEGPE